MPIRRTPRGRRGIIEEPGRTTVEFSQPLNPDGSRPVTEEEEAALTEIVEAIRQRPTTFDEFVGPTEELARRIIEKHGGIRGGQMPLEGGTQKAGYVIPGDVEKGSQLDYALEVLWLLLFARSKDIDEARRYAWMAGLHTQEAVMKFKWEAHALRGEKNLESTRNAARAKAEVARKNSAVNNWLKEVQARRTGSAEAAYARIERRERLQPGTVRRAIYRLKSRSRSQ